MPVYERKGSQYIWSHFEFNGQRYQKSTKVLIKRDGSGEITKSTWKEAEDWEAEAKQILRRGGDIEMFFRGGAPEPEETAEVKTCGQLLDALKEDYEERKIDTTANLSVIRLAKEQFDKLPANEVTDESLKKLRKKMQGEGYADGTIKNRIQPLIQAFTLAKLPPLTMPDLDLDNAREGFVTDGEIDALVKEFDTALRDFVLFGYLVGWRKEAISTLTWSDVEGDVIRLRARNSKNGKAYHIPFDEWEEVSAIIERRRKARAVKTADGTALSNLVFHRDGAAIYEFRKSWQTACMALGLGAMACPKCGAEGSKACKKCRNVRLFRGKVRECPMPCKYRGRIFHDLRRSAVRNMIRSGVPPKVAMRISGHETDSMLWRYDITADDDLRHATVKMAKRRETERKRVVELGG